MANPQQLKQSVDKSRRDLEQETRLLMAKETELRTKEQEFTKFRQEIADMQKQLDLKKLKVTEYSRAIPRLRTDVNRLRQDHQLHSNSLQKMQREFDKTTKSSR
ncbi:MAG: hypothetical protein QOG91_82 [Candidatus Parcubacteria bacterium]|jgi:chromosome segregation ATPase|nr:hypothetical protein [Candidatus Parcubacteria bacterium]